MKREVGGGVFQRNVHTPDRSNQRNNRNLSNNSRIGKLKKSPISNSHLNTSNNSRIKRNLSEDKIIPKNGNYVNGSKINPVANNNYNRHHYNKTPSPIRKKKLIYQRVIFLLITELKVTQMRALHIMLQIHNVFMIINNAYKPVILVPKILIIIIIRVQIINLPKL